MNHLHRPFVGNDVMDGQQQPVFLMAQMNHGPAEQRGLRQVERFSPLLMHHADPPAFPFRLRQRTEIEF